MANWIPFHAHSFYSLLDGLSSPDQMLQRCKAEGYAGMAVTDHGVLSGCMKFNKLGSDVFRPLLGSEFYLCKGPSLDAVPENRALSHLCVVAKNHAGWRGMVKASSLSHRRERFYHKPRLTRRELAEHCGGNWIVFSGHPGSELADCLFQDHKLSYRAKNVEQARGMLKDNWMDEALALADEYSQLFGKENFALEIQLIDAHNLPAAAVIGECLRAVAKKGGHKVLATADSHYPNKADAEDQRILLCSNLHTTMGEVRRKLDADEDVTLGGFFRSTCYHIPSLREIESLHTEQEIAQSLAFFEMCEKYSLSGPPTIPQFECPDGMTPDQYLHKLCQDGWVKYYEHKIKNDKIKEYGDRVKHELEVIKTAGLATYFLIVADIVNWARSQGWKVGPGRGSAAGCMISSLVGITSIDPVRHGLIFERFYNAGRIVPGQVSLPDIDCDFQIAHKPLVNEYIRQKYGRNRVSQISTFGRLQGRAVLKEVLRVHGWGSFDERNAVTLPIPDESKITDELQEMDEAGEESGILLWALKNKPKELRDYCSLDDNGNYSGPLAKYFAQAIRLEGVIKSRGKHAGGVVISTRDLDEEIPLVYDSSSKEMIASWDMHDLEAAGLVKMDILGVAALDKIADCVATIRKGGLPDELDAATEDGVVSGEVQSVACG